MTMRTSYGLTCTCGHKGTVKMSENDSPYSVSWESYSLDGFEGGTFSKEGAAAGWPEVFANLQPICPQCRRALTADNLSDH